MTEEEIRIGVYVCHCGINIGSVIDVPGVVEYASKLDDVVTASSVTLPSSERAEICSGDDENNATKLPTKTTATTIAMCQ